MFGDQNLGLKGLARFMAKRRFRYGGSASVHNVLPVTFYLYDISLQINPPCTGLRPSDTAYLRLSDTMPDSLGSFQA